MERTLHGVSRIVRLTGPISGAPVIPGAFEAFHMKLGQRFLDDSDRELFPLSFPTFVIKIVSPLLLASGCPGLCLESRSPTEMADPIGSFRDRQKFHRN